MNDVQAYEKFSAVTCTSHSVTQYSGCHYFHKTERHKSRQM